MYKYEVIVWWSDADQAYLAEVPELAGCIADGPSYTEAVETAKELGRPIPEPKGRRLALT